MNQSSDITSMESLLDFLHHQQLTATIEQGQIICPFKNGHSFNIRFTDSKSIRIFGIFLFNEVQKGLYLILSEQLKQSILKSVFEYLSHFHGRFFPYINEKIAVGIDIAAERFAAEFSGLKMNIEIGLDLCGFKLDELLWLASPPQSIRDVIISKQLQFYIPNTEEPFQYNCNGYNVLIEARNYPFVPHESFIIANPQTMDRSSGGRIQILNSAEFPTDEGSIIKITVQNYSMFDNANLTKLLEMCSHVANIFIQTYSFCTEIYNNVDIINLIPKDSFGKTFVLRTNTILSANLISIGKSYRTYSEEHKVKIAKKLTKGGLSFEEELFWEAQVNFNTNNYKFAYLVLAVAVDSLVQNYLLNHPQNDAIYQKCRFDPDDGAFQLRVSSDMNYKGCGFMRMLFEAIKDITTIDLEVLIPDIFENMDILYGVRCNIMHSNKFEYKETLYHAKRLGHLTLIQGGIELVLKFNTIYKAAKEIEKAIA